MISVGECRGRGGKEEGRERGMMNTWCRRLYGSEKQKEEGKERREKRNEGREKGRSEVINV